MITTILSTGVGISASVCPLHYACRECHCWHYEVAISRCNICNSEKTSWIRIYSVKGLVGASYQLLFNWSSDSNWCGSCHKRYSVAWGMELTFESVRSRVIILVETHKELSTETVAIEAVENGVREARRSVFLKRGCYETYIKRIQWKHYACICICGWLFSSKRAKMQKKTRE